MKKLSQIKGATRLTRKEQQHITGGTCNQDGDICCERVDINYSSTTLCAPGICTGTLCFWFEEPGEF